MLVEALDASLLRLGRMDYKLFMGEAADTQRVELYRRFFPESSEADARDFAQAHNAATMAEFQGLLLGLEQESELVRGSIILIEAKCRSFLFASLRPEDNSCGQASTSGRGPGCGS